MPTQSPSVRPPFVVICNYSWMSKNLMILVASTKFGLGNAIVQGRHDDHYLSICDHPHELYVESSLSVLFTEREAGHWTLL